MTVLIAKTKIYVWEFRSCVQVRHRCQAIIQWDSWLQNARIKSCNLIIASWHSLLNMGLKRLSKSLNCFAKNA